MRGGIFGIGAVILVIGLIVIMIYGGPAGAMESMFGGWAMVNEDYREWRSLVSLGQILAVIGIIVMIPGIILKKKSENS